MKNPFHQVWSYILLINTAKRPPSKIHFSCEKLEQLKNCPEKSYCSPYAAPHAHQCVVRVSVTILIDSQARPPHRESESPDFSLIPEWRFSQKVVKSHDQKVDRALNCINTVQKLTVDLFVLNVPLMLTDVAVYHVYKCNGQQIIECVDFKRGNLKSIEEIESLFFYFCLL